jgi:hypothetical protein
MFAVFQAPDDLVGGLPAGKLGKHLFDVLHFEGALFESVLSNDVTHEISIAAPRRKSPYKLPKRKSSKGLALTRFYSVRTGGILSSEMRPSGFVARPGSYDGEAYASIYAADPRYAGNDR